MAQGIHVLEEEVQRLQVDLAKLEQRVEETCSDLIHDIDDDEEDDFSSLGVCLSPYHNHHTLFFINATRVHPNPYPYW